MVFAWRSLDILLSHHPDKFLETDLYLVFKEDVLATGPAVPEDREDMHFHVRTSYQASVSLYNDVQTAGWVVSAILHQLHFPLVYPILAGFIYIGFFSCWYKLFRYTELLWSLFSM